MNSGTIYNASAVVGAGLNNDLLLSGAITLNGDINMANFTLNNVRNVNKSDINLSLIPATAGSPGQVLTRASNFNINDPLTAQLEWTTPTGGVTNPLSGILDCNGFGLYNVSSITSQNSGSFNISINGSLLFIQNIPVLSSPNGLRIRVAEIFNTGLVTSFLDDCVFSKVVLFANGIETNTIKQRTGTALALTSPTINISGSTAINLTGPTNCINDATFQQAVRTNFIQSQANTPLIIAALMSDGKTQTNMHLTSPVIQLDNSYGLVNEAAVYISGNLTFNNPVSNPHITGRNLNIYSRTNANPPVNTPLSISSSTCNISQETLNITSSVSNNITGQTNFDKKYKCIIK